MAVFFAREIDDRFFNADPPFVLKSYGLFIKWIAQGWTGPVKLFYTGEQSVSLPLWAGPAKKDEFYPLEIVLTPHQKGSLFLKGAIGVLWGTRQPCGCTSCQPLVPGDWPSLDRGSSLPESKGDKGEEKGGGSELEPESAEEAVVDAGESAAGVSGGPTSGVEARPIFSLDFDLASRLRRLNELLEKP